MGGKLRFIPPPPMMHYLEISACELTFCRGKFYIYPPGKAIFSSPPPVAIIVNLRYAKKLVLDQLIKFIQNIVDLHRKNKLSVENL